MYVGNYFKTCLEYAKTYKSDIYILSAKYGLLSLEDYIEPYNLTLNTFSKRQKEDWNNKVKKQLSEKHIDNEKAVFLCGKNYYLGLLDYFQEVELPLSNCKGMGLQLAFLKSLLNNEKISKPLF